MTFKSVSLYNNALWVILPTKSYYTPPLTLSEEDVLERNPLAAAARFCRIEIERLRGMETTTTEGGFFPKSGHDPKRRKGGGRGGAQTFMCVCVCLGRRLSLIPPSFSPPTGVKGLSRAICHPTTSTVEYGYLHHFGPTKFDAKLRLMRISVER